MTGRPSDEFLDQARALETAYLTSDEPEALSGFSGGRQRWIAERSPLVRAIDGDGDFLDVGCANGLLAADVVTWAAAKGHMIVPHGVDLGSELVGLARERHPTHATNFHVADAWQWNTDHRWRYVYSLLDLSPPELRCEWIQRLIEWVAPGGRLIMGSYGSRSRRLEPEDPAAALDACGYEVSGTAIGGSGVTRFAWTDHRRHHNQ